MQHTVTTGYGTDGRISSAGFTHGGAVKQFGYEYLSGTNLLHKLTKPNNMTLTQTYEATRDLLTGMAYHRGSTLVAQREYTYDILGRPTARNTARNGQIVNDTFAHNTRSELTSATVNGADYEYAYDNIGNRQQSTEGNDVTVYDANALNQYTAISENGASAFVPQFDADGNQTLIKTDTGIWSAVYNAENRPVTFTNSESNTVVECQYDSMGRRAYKKVTVNGNVTLHQRYIYRGYLQIACIDLTRSHHPVMWLVTWDPTQPVATRPLAIRINGTWYTYGWDLTKNICELYSTEGRITTSYTYSPFGKVTTTGSLTQPILWSSEMWDSELGLVYHVHRSLNVNYATWTSRDLILKSHLYKYSNNNPLIFMDLLGLLEVYHSTNIEAVKDILEHGYKGDFLWTGEKGAKAGGGQPWQLRNDQVIKLDVPDRLISNAVEISYEQVHSYYEAGQGKYKTPAEINAYRWNCVKDFMSNNPSNVFIVHPERGGKPRWIVIKVKSINKSGIKLLEIPKIDALGVDVPMQLKESGKKINITKYINVKNGLVGLSFAIGAYELYTVRNSPKEMTKVVYGWAGSYIGMKYGAAMGAGGALVVGQMGPQIATPEEALTIPIASFIGSIIGGITGAIAGSVTTEIVDYFTLSKGVEL